MLKKFENVGKGQLSWPIETEKVSKEGEKLLLLSSVETGFVDSWAKEVVSVTKEKPVKYLGFNVIKFLIEYEDVSLIGVG